MDESEAALVGRDDSLIARWLEAIRRDCPELYEASLVPMSGTGPMASFSSINGQIFELGSLHNVALASATYCAELARKERIRDLSTLSEAGASLGDIDSSRYADSSLECGLAPHNITIELRQPQAEIDQAVRAKHRLAWMESRHPEWGINQWANHSGNDYKTIKKFQNGIKNSRTKSVRLDIAHAEKVEFSTVPE